jgi:hypothetical protein
LGFNIDVLAIDVVWNDQVAVPSDDGCVGGAGDECCRSSGTEVLDKTIRKHGWGFFL